MSLESLKEEAMRWLSTAEDDLKAAQSLASHRMHAHACFQCQQCGACCRDVRLPYAATVIYDNLKMERTNL